MLAQPLPGFRDFPPADLAVRAHLFAAWRAVARRYGFEEYDGPPLEPLELYTQKSGDEIVGQLYAFTDKGDRQVALRPEMTPTFARMAAARANGLRKPIRWFSVPQLFRYERQQRGRLREHFQLNCDLAGEPGPLADAEMIALAVDILRELGLGPRDVRVRLSDRRLLQAVLARLGVVAAAWPAAYQTLDKLGRSEAARAREAFAAAGGTGEQLAALEAAVGAAGPVAPDHWRTLVPADDPAAAAFGQVLDALGAMGLGAWVDVDLTIVRGLAYYTGTVFELFDAGRTLRAIAGGGRYDGLVGALAGVELPCVGFGMGDVVLGELLRDRGLAPEAPAAVACTVVGVTADDLPHVLALAHELRDAGVAVEYALGGQPMRKQLELANARRARAVLVVGPDDRARGEVQLKDLRAGAQRAVARAQAVAEAAALLAS